MYRCRGSCTAIRRQLTIQSTSTRDNPWQRFRRRASGDLRHVDSQAVTQLVFYRGHLTRGRE